MAEAPHERRPRTPLPRDDDQNKRPSFWRTFGGRFWALILILLVLNYLSVAIFDHAKNPRHPTWWHARDYGLFAANPFGQHDFEPKSTLANAGRYTLPPGGSLTLRYRVLLHLGDEKTARLAERFAEYASGK